MFPLEDQCSKGTRKCLDEYWVHFDSDSYQVIILVFIIFLLSVSEVEQDVTILI